MMKNVQMGSRLVESDDESEDEVGAVEQVADFLPKLTNEELSRARINPVTLLFNSKDLEMHFIAFYHGVTGPGHMLFFLLLILKNGEFVKTPSRMYIICDIALLRKASQTKLLALRYPCPFRGSDSIRATTRSSNVA